jgi:hypothetical protein
VNASPLRRSRDESGAFRLKYFSWVLLLFLTEMAATPS